MNKLITMHKLLFFLCSLFFIACNNNQSSAPAAEKNAAKSSNPIHMTSLSEKSELEILSGCVDNAKANLGEAKAYSLCKCILGQVQQKHPGADSSALVTHLSDTAEVAQMAKQCQ